MSNLAELEKSLQAKGGLPVIPAIKDSDDYNRASDSIAFLKRYTDEAEKRRKVEVAPLVEEKRNIDGKYKKFTLPLEATVAKIKSAMLGYAMIQRESQKLLEAETLANNESDLIVVDDLSVDKSRGEFSSSSIRTTTKYRFKNVFLNDVIEIPQLKFKQFLEKNTLPDFIESYEEESVAVRKSF